MKKIIKLTESDLHKIVENTVNRVLNEVGDTHKGQKKLGKLFARQEKDAKNVDFRKKPYEWSDKHTKAHDTWMHAYKNSKEDKSIADPEHPFNQGYDEYNKKNESRNRKSTIKLSESDLHNIIRNTVNRVLGEAYKPSHNRLKGGYDILRNTNWNSISHESNFRDDLASPQGNYWEEYDKADAERNNSNLEEDVDFEDEQENDEFNPWLDGTASWIDGDYDVNGRHVKIDTKYSTVAIDDQDENEEESYFLQGDEADNLISDICRYYVENEVEPDVAVETVISNSGY